MSDCQDGAKAYLLADAGHRTGVVGVNGEGLHERVLAGQSTADWKPNDNEDGCLAKDNIMHQSPVACCMQKIIYIF